MADVTTTGPGLAGRERVRAHDGEGAGYRTFSARVPALLGIVGGSFGVLGALGTGVRASAVRDVREDPQQVGVIMGYRSGAGWLLAILAVVVMGTALGWLGRRRLFRSIAAASAIAFVVLAAMRVSSLDRKGAELAAAARRAPDFVGFHAGLGWGAWMLLVALILAGFAALVGAMRALDLRKGLGE